MIKLIAENAKNEFILGIFSAMLSQPDKKIHIYQSQLIILTYYNKTDSHNMQSSKKCQTLLEIKVIRSLK